jgi:hypothetical protein
MTWYANECDTCMIFLAMEFGGCIFLADKASNTESQWAEMQGASGLHKAEPATGSGQGVSFTLHSGHMYFVHTHHFRLAERI